MKKKLSLLLLLFLIIFLVGCVKKTTTIPLRNYQDITVTDDTYRNYYEIFVSSFYDSNGDGLGDINGVKSKLDYIKDLGYNGIWLMPTTSGYSYHKYDVVDYYNVDSDFGTNDDMKAFLEAAHEKGIDVLMDLVVNHTSSYNKWFIQATEYIKKFGTPGGQYGEYYNFTKTSQPGYSSISGTSYYYECRFTDTMPDLNLDSEIVRGEIIDIMAFWLDMGFDGFRLDATTSYYTDNTEKNVEFLKFLNTEAKKIKSDAYLVGEAWLGSDSLIKDYYESTVDSFFTFPLAQGTGEISALLRDGKTSSGSELGSLITKLQKIYGDSIMAPFLSNHDTTRVSSFIGKGNKDKIKMAEGILTLINGALFTYYGEEIGMISYSNTSDPSKRLPIAWSSSEAYPGKVTKTPENILIKDGTYCFGTVEDEINDANSIYNYYKYSMYIRNANPEIARGTNIAHSEYERDYPTCLVLEKKYQNKSIFIIINLSGTESYNIALNQEQLGFNKMTYELATDASLHVTFDDESDIVSLPPYSYSIFR